MLAVTSRGGCGLPSCSNNIDTTVSRWRWSQCGWLGRPATSLSGTAYRAPGCGATGVPLTIVHILAGFALVAQQVQQSGVDMLAVANQSGIAQVGILAAFGSSEEVGVLGGQRGVIQAADKVGQAL